jgi:redox-sensing transcriptional repressor
VRKNKVPEPTVARLVQYSHTLENLCRQGTTIVSSEEIAHGAGVFSSQVRKDLACFGEFGTRGLGYNVRELLDQTRTILGVNRPWPVIMVGAGKLARALATYRGFAERNFDIVAVFDNDLTKIGGKIGQIDIHPLETLPAIVGANGVVIGIITVPAGAARPTARLMVDNGLTAILNFARVHIEVPEHVVLHNVDLSAEIGILTFKLCHPFVSFCHDPPA